MRVYRMEITSSIGVLTLSFRSETAVELDLFNGALRKSICIIYLFLECIFLFFRQMINTIYIFHNYVFVVRTPTWLRVYTEPRR